MSDGAKIALALAGVAVLGGVGYYFWNQQQQAATAAAGGSSISSGQQPYQLGTSTSTVMPPASAQGTSYDPTTTTAYGPGYSAANPPQVAVNAGELG